MEALVHINFQGQSGNDYAVFLAELGEWLLAYKTNIGPDVEVVWQEVVEA